MATLSPNPSITLSQRRCCVLDPSLFLSHYGLLLVRSLGEVLELWIARELWHILDNPSFCLAQPELVMPQYELELSPELQTVAQQKKTQVLRSWESLRAETLARHLNLFWIGDRPADSFLPHDTDPQLMERWEAVAQSLDERLREHSPSSPISSSIMESAFRDTAALAAVLGSAFILTHQPSGESDKMNSLPEICQVLEQWGIPCQQIDALDAIAALERENLLHLIVATGCSKFLWAGLHLVVFHLVVPSTFTCYCKAQHPWTAPSFGEENDLTTSPNVANIWEGAQGFWYQL